MRTYRDSLPETVWDQLSLLNRLQTGGKGLDLYVNARQGPGNQTACTPARVQKLLAAYKPRPHSVATWHAVYDSV